MDLIAEIKRKSVHSVGNLVPILYFFFEKRIALILLFSLMMIVLILEFLRLRFERVNRFFLWFFSGLEREHERKGISAPAFTSISFFLTVLLFSKEIAIAALFFLTLGDTVAALVGRRFGKRRFQDKSLEGSLACFLTCLFIGLLILDFKLALFGALAATLAEASPLRIDDNFKIPLFSGGVMQVLKIISLKV
ncbi:MAG: diacylglycerol/polyprenol kinase family protein [Candidatus Methanofastidiosia archaeon]